MSKGGSPAAPDYAAAAKEQGTANIQAAIAQGIMGRPNQITPLGSQTFEQTGTRNVGGQEIPMFTGTESLSPEMQRIFDATMGGQGAAAQRAAGVAGSEFDVNRIPGIADTAIDRNSVRDALVARQEGAIGRDRDNTSSDLIARGIPEGSEAFNREMDRLDRMTVDARQQAELGAGQAQTQALDSRRQLIQEALLNRQQPFNELSALQGGGQSGLPQFGQPQGAQTIAPPDIMGATQAQYGAAADAANFKNAQRGQTTNLAGAALMAYAMF